MPNRMAGWIGAGWALALAGTARAADEEIQVYMDEIGPLRRPTLDVHLNYVAQGRTLPSYAGEQASEGRFRITPEWAYALSPNLELGAYLPLAEVDRRGNLEAGGVKGRVKWVAPRADGQTSFWGLNFEVGRVRRDLDINPWNAELKAIAGLRKGPWILAANLNLDWVVAGPDAGSPPELQVAAKAGYALDQETSVGIETYNAIGTTRALGRLSYQDSQAYLVIDRGFGAWNLNFGVGYGYGAPEDRWVVKAVVGVPLS